VGTGKSARVLAPTVTVAEVPRAEVPRAELPRAPELSVETPQPSQALADVVPMPVSNGTATAPKEIGLIDRGHALTPDSASTAQTHASSPEPAVSITNSGTGAGSQGGSRKKWMVIAAIGAAAGVGGFLALSGHGGSGSKSSSTGVAIGTPTISVSH
jgi:hypothetical protein